MKRVISLILVLAIGLSLCACGSSGNSTTADSSGAASNKDNGFSISLPASAEEYVPMKPVETDFGQIVIMDAAFTAKTQLFYSKSSSTRKTTVNGKTTETYTETIHPGYYSAKDGKILFGLRTMMTNSTPEDMEIHNLKVTAKFGNSDSVYFSKGGNFHISEDAYKILPAGSTAEIMLSAAVPVETYLGASECILDVGGAKVSFQYDDINIYASMGYQEEDNQSTVIDSILLAAQQAHTPVVQPTTEPVEPDPEIDMIPAVYSKDGSGKVEGRAVILENVSIGFIDQLPPSVSSSRQLSHRMEELTLSDTQVYAVVSFTATNLTAETVDLADIGDDFVVLLRYNNKYRYASNNDTASVFISGTNIKISKNRSTSGQDISVPPLAATDVTVYIPCAREVSTSDKPLTVTFASRFSGSESHTFNIR